MKKIALLICAAVLFTGCNSDNNESSSPRETITVTSTPDATESLTADSTAEDIYLLTLDSRPDLYLGISDTELLRLGYGTCDLLDQGLTLNQMMLTYAEENIDPEFAGYLTGAAVVAFCPAYENQIDALDGTGA